MFLWFVQKMRQALSFLATFQNDDLLHENAGHYFDSGAAYGFRGGLHGPDSDQRSADAKGELTRLRSSWGTTGDAFSGSISQTHQRARRGDGIFDRIPDFWNHAFSPGHVHGEPVGRLEAPIGLLSINCIGLTRRTKTLSYAV